MEENSNPNYMHDEDEAEETLSLCDLPIYSSSDSSEWDKFSKEDQTLSCSYSTSSSSDQDFFEFFSEEWSASSSIVPVGQNIVFCGKLIPFKELPPTKNLENPTESGLLRWKSKWFGREERKSKSKRTNDKPKGGGRPVRRASLWQLMVFGLARRPVAGMGMGEIRSRQRRRGSPAALVRAGGTGEVTVREGEGLWGLIRALGCSGSPAVLETQYLGCVPST